MKEEVKEIEYKGEKFKVGLRSYAYTDSKFIINGEDCDESIRNKDLLDIENYKIKAKYAIQEYIDRRNSNKTFKDWDGKLD